MLIAPFPSISRINIPGSREGSPKNFAPPCSSSVIRLLWIAPTVAGEILPYSVRSSFA